MNIPKYVIDLMSRARYNYTANGENYAAGYTIDIAKYSHYETAQTFRKEIERLVNWANRQEGAAIDLDVMNAYVLSIPNKSKNTYLKHKQNARRIIPAGVSHLMLTALTQCRINRLQIRNTVGSDLK